MSGQSFALPFGQDLRQNKEFIFASFRKGFDKDISPATISSWIKQLWSCAMSSLTKRPSPYTRLKLMRCVHSLLPRHSNQESPWNKYCQPAIESHIAPSYSSIWKMWLGLIHSSTISGQKWLLSRSTSSPHYWGDLYKYIVVHSKKRVTCFVWEVYFLGLNSSLSSPTSEQVC